MRKLKANRTDEELRQGADSVNYEIAMLLRTYIYRADPRDFTMRNMIIESFLVHVRNLFEFLYKQEELHRDEVRSVHYITDSEKRKIWKGQQKKFEKKLHDEMSRIHKRLAHISYDRDSLDRKWPKSNLVRELRDMMRSFIIHVPEDKKSWFKIDELLKFEIKENRPQITDSTSNFQGTIIFTESNLGKSNSNPIERQ